MSRYIDADELLKAMDTWDKFGFSHSGAFVREPENDDYVPYVHYDDMVKCVKTMPTADVVEVKHGKWIKTEGRYSWHCSLCKVDDQFAYCWNREKGDYDFQDNYCPSCGARMDGE